MKVCVKATKFQYDEITCNHKVISFMTKAIIKKILLEVFNEITKIKYKIKVHLY